MLRRWPSGARDGMRRRADGVRARGALSPAAEGRARGPRLGAGVARRGQRWVPQCRGPGVVLGPNLVDARPARVVHGSAATSRGPSSMRASAFSVQVNSGS
jgi:hypothetical protein